MSLTVRIQTNAADVRKRLNNDSAGTVQVIKRAFTKYMREVIKIAKSPNYGFTDRTGRLRKSIRILGTSRAGPNTKVIKSSFGSKVEYADYVESGHNMRYSYIGRAQKRANLEKIITQEIDSFLQKE